MMKHLWCRFILHPVLLFTQRRYSSRRIMSQTCSGNSESAICGTEQEPSGSAMFQFL
ncbi:Uncharacterized protein DAT39_015877, partial [Clarias magur]